MGAEPAHGRRHPVTRVLIWATHLQTDILALTSHLDRCSDVELLIVTPNVAAFRDDLFYRQRPFTAPLIDRNDRDTPGRVRVFKADVAIADNHVPPKGYAPRLFYIWHGLGWKARSKLDLRIFYHQVRRLTGYDPRTPNPNFRAQCYGPTDRAWRIDNWRLPESACVEIGMTFSDLVLNLPYDRAEIAKELRIDILNRPTIALAITWHSGGIFANGPGGNEAVPGADFNFLSEMLALAKRRRANLLICLHDRHRYFPKFIAMLEALARDNTFVELRFKNEHPDNMVDLFAADVMISNYSSFLSYFYLLGRPAIHLLPAMPSDRVSRVAMLFSRVPIHRRLAAEEAWMLDPRDNGGILVSNSSDAVAATDAALRALTGHPRNDAARLWLHKHVFHVDGHTAERFKAEIDKLCASA